LNIPTISQHTVISSSRSGNQTPVILPVTQSNHISLSKDLVPRSDYRYKFLSGNRPEVTKTTCGQFVYLGCLEHNQHGHKILAGQKTLTNDQAKSYDHITVRKLSCGKLDCPVCYEKACAKQAVKIENRLKQFKWTNRKTTKYYHWTVSVSSKDYHLTPKQLRHKAIKIAKLAGIKGGGIVFHHLRRYQTDDSQTGTFEQGSDWKTAPASWYFSPHFHVLGVGFTSPKKIFETYQKTGWVTKNLGERESIRATALYQLSHAYIPEKGHAFVWFGLLSYNSFKSKPVPIEKPVCPECGTELQRVKPISSKLDIVKTKLTDEGEYVIESGLFEYCDTKKRNWVGYG